MSYSLIIRRKGGNLRTPCSCCRLRAKHPPLQPLIEFVVFPGIHVYTLTFSLLQFSGCPDRSVPTPLPLHTNIILSLPVVARKKLVLISNYESCPKSCN